MEFTAIFLPDGTFALFNLLEEVVIRRTRAFIRSAYPEATIAGKKIHFPKRRLRTVRYILEATYCGIYNEIVSGIESLALAPYNLESYKKKGVEIDESRPNASRHWSESSRAAI